MRKPVAYRTPQNEWLCPACRPSWNAPAVPFYDGDMTQDHVCLTCRRTLERCVPTVEPCVFCDIIAGREPVEWVLQPDYWPDVVAFIPLNPVTEGHCLIVPKVHVRDFAQDPEVFAATACRAAELMQFTPRPMAVLTLRGEEAGQEVPHLHLHLIPREAGDGLRIISRIREGKRR